MALSDVERAKRARARKRGEQVPKGTPGRKPTGSVPAGLPEYHELVALVRALDRRVCDLEDGPRAVRAADTQPKEMASGCNSPVERPGLGDLQARIDQVVTRTDGPATVTATFDPRTLTGQALRDYVRRYGPIPTDDPGDAA